MSDFPYDDILYLPHHVSKTRKRMSMTERGAQFSPFAALTGYDAAIEETARLTDGKVELDESVKEEIADTLFRISERQNEHPTISVTYFEEDSRKEGGRYITATGTVRILDVFKREIVLTDRETIPMDAIYSITILS